MATQEMIREVESLQGHLKDLKELANKYKQLEINQKKAHLERQFRNKSNAAEIADETTRLQRLASEITEFTKTKKFYQLRQVIAVTLNETRKFHENFCIAAPEEVFCAFDLALKALQASLALMVKAAKNIQLLSELSEDSSEKNLRNWAIKLEILAEELENNLPLLSVQLLNHAEDFCNTVVLKSRRKGENAETKRESYRRRIRFAAGFILNLVETAREEAIEEDREVLHALRLLGRKTIDTIYSEDTEHWEAENQTLSENT